MKRILAGPLLALSLAVSSTIARPAPRASADCNAGDAILIALVSRGIALPYYLDNCGNSSGASDPCYGQGIGNVDVNGTTSQHYYKWSAKGSCPFDVSASYDVNRKGAVEKITSGQGKIEATYTCEADPWIVAWSQQPTCLLINGMATSPDFTLSLGASQTPISVITLTDFERSALAAQLQNALNQKPVTPSPNPADVPVTAKASKTCAACTLGSQQAPTTYHAPTIIDGWPQLALSTEGEAVKSLQYLLQASGATLSVDGKFGPQTDSAVRAFQTAQGLKVDGVVGPQTWGALLVTVQQGDQGPAVEAVQSQLASRGVTLAVDGKFGPQTNSAVRDYQQAHALSVDGIAGPQTWQALLTGL